MQEIPTIYGYTLTQALIIAGVIFYSLYDLVAVSLWGRDVSVSVTLIDICRKSPEIAFIAGLIIGHIFLHVANR